MLHRRLMLILVLLFAALWPATAQADEAGPLPVGDPRHLLDLLRYVPVTSQVAQSYITYGDFRAAEAARAGVPQYPSFAAFLRDRTVFSAIWRMSLPQGGYEALYQFLFEAGENMPEAVGFDFFDMDRTLQFGQPPALGIVVQGQFDAEAIATAHAARDYTRDDRDGYTLWCGPVGCANGNQVNIASRNLGNIFGGELGREFPLALLEETGVIVSSADLGIVQSSAAGAGRTVADDVVYQMAIEALVEADSGLLRTAMLLPPTLLNPAGIDLSRILQPGATAEQIAEAQAQLAETYGDLPPYSLAFFADMATRDDQTAFVGLVYNTRANAEAAADVLAARLQVAESLVTSTPWLELLEQREMALSDALLYQREDGDMAVLLLPFVYPAPLASMPASSGLSGPQMAAMGYRLLMGGLFLGDLVWLAYDLGF